MEEVAVPQEFQKTRHDEKEKGKKRGAFRRKRGKLLGRTGIVIKVE